MNKILTKKIQIQISDYFSTTTSLSKPEVRSMKDMVLGILKSKSTFMGLQSMLALLTIAMHIIYKKIKSIHLEILLDAGYNYLNKHEIRELTNFIYYKVSKIVSILLMPTRLRHKIQSTTTQLGVNQLSFTFD